VETVDLFLKTMNFCSCLSCPLTVLAQLLMLILNIINIDYIVIIGGLGIYCIFFTICLFIS